MNSSNPQRKEVLRKYKITVEQYDEKLEQQNGVCVICSEKPSPKKALCVDHNHDTNEIRDLLCVRCNTIVGKFKEDPEIIDRAMEYLKNASNS